MNMEDVVIVAAGRTAVGKFGGTLAKIAAADLGAHVLKALLTRTGLKGDQIDEVILGQVLTAGCGQNPARQASIRAGIHNMVPAMTLGKVCGSGLKATHLAAQAIKCGDAEIVIAGGQENMSASPHILPNSRDGYRMGDAKIVDSMIVDGLWDAFNQYHMGTTAENVAKSMRSRVVNRTNSPLPRNPKPRPHRKRADSRMRSLRSKFRSARVRP
jgi:acetyl-CoA C-acetyltransferase